MQEIILNIDVAPTMIDLAGLSEEPQSVTDGQSFKALLTGDPVSKWRSEFLVEHQGEMQEIIDGCPDLSYQNVSVSLASCPNLRQQNVAVSLALCAGVSHQNITVSLVLKFITALTSSLFLLLFIEAS